MAFFPSFKRATVLANSAIALKAKFHSTVYILTPVKPVASIYAELSRAAEVL